MCENYYGCSKTKYVFHQKHNNIMSFNGLVDLMRAYTPMSRGTNHHIMILLTKDRIV